MFKEGFLLLYHDTPAASISAADSIIIDCQWAEFDYMLVSPVGYSLQYFDGLDDDYLPTHFPRLYGAES